MASWLTASAWLTLRIVLPGMAWSWWAGANGRTTSGSFLVRSACTLVIGLLCSSLTAVTLGVAGVYSPTNEWLTLSTLTVVGLVVALLTHRDRMAAALRDAALLFIMAWLVVIAVLALPQRGEWLLGGWDPGVYVNEGVALDQQHTFYPEDAFYWNQLTEQERTLFLRTVNKRTERFPAVVIDPERQAFQFEFFRLTPALFAMAHRSGGLPLLHRMNTLLALVFALTFYVILAREGQRTWGVVVVLLLLSQPILLYHAHTPVTEMTELFILAGLFLLLPYRTAHSCVPFLFALALLGGGLNRFTFIPFASFFVLLLAVLDMGRIQRRRVYMERILQIGALAIALTFDSYVAPTSMAGWSDHLLRNMYWMTGLCAAGALLLDSAAPLAQAPWLRRTVLPAMRWIGLAGGTMAFAYFVARAWFGPRIQDADNGVKLVHYMGIIPLLLSIVGAWMYWARARLNMQVIHALGIFTACISLLMIYQKNIVDWYPWATRRYVTCAVPFVALFASYPLALAWKKGKALRIAAVIIMAVSALSVAKQTYKAWSHTEYNGIASQLAALHNQIGPGDIVIADDPRWGTPLTFIHGIHVLNGKRLWEDASGEKLILALEMAERLSRAGMQVRFFTSTDKALTLYPHTVAPVSLDWQAEPFTYKEIIHHPRATSYDRREAKKFFRLYTYLPDI